MMRRVTALVLAGVGTFLIVGAILLPTWVSGNVLKFPLNEYESATLIGKNVQYFNTKLLTEESGVTMQATYTIKGDGAAGNGSTAVWKEFAYTYDKTNGQQYQYTTQTSAFNRRTGLLVDCCGANINGDSSIRQTGYVGWVFPFNTQKQTYDIFDTTLDKPEPYVYSGTTTSDGIQTYEYVENIAPTKFGSISGVPGYFIGSSAKSATADEYYQTHQIYYVDPETGALLNVNEFEEVTLVNPATGATGLVMFKGDMIETPASLATIVGLDNTGRTEMSLMTLILPLVFGIVGAICLVVGIIIGRKRSADAEPVEAPLTGPVTPLADEATITTDSGVNGQAAAADHDQPAADDPASATAPPAAADES
jgi:hypothetical protein